MKTLLTAIAIVAASPAAAQDCVSTELVLLADISSSMTMEERKIQRQGYISAFRSGEVLDAIMGSYCGQIVVQYVEFGNHPFVVADWHMIQTDEDAEAFAQAIEVADPIATPDGGYLTGIARAIKFAGESLAENGITAERQVIDVSADGGDNINGVCSKDQVAAARDALTTPTAENGWQEVIINALPIVGGGQTVGTCGLGLSDYMDKYVRGGRGSFLMEANGVSDLPRIVRNKLAQEVM